MINILLLEDDQAIAQSFIRKYSSDLIIIKVVLTVPEVFHELDNQEFDMVIIDPVMSHTLDFSRLLEELCKRKVELKIVYPDNFDPRYYVDQANRKNVQSIPLNDTTQLFNIIEGLLRKKSGNTSELRETDKRLEIKLIRTEVHLENLNAEVIKQGDKIEEIESKLNQQTTSLVELKNNQTYMIDSLKHLNSNVGEIAAEMDSLNKQDPKIQLELKDKEESTKKFLGILAIVTTLLTVLGSIAVPFSGVVTEWIKTHSQLNNPAKNK